MRSVNVLPSSVVFDSPKPRGGDAVLLLDSAPYVNAALSTLTQKGADFSDNRLGHFCIFHLRSPYIGSVYTAIMLILSRCAPFKVCQPIITAIAVEMTRLKAVWRRAFKGFQNKNVNRPAPRAVIDGKVNGQVFRVGFRVKLSKLPPLIPQFWRAPPPSSPTVATTPDRAVSARTVAGPFGDFRVLNHATFYHAGDQ